MTNTQEMLALTGLLLFMFGLVNGMLIPLMRSPRLALSAHLTALQGGTFLIAVAWVWPYFGFGLGWSFATALLLLLSIIAFWVANLLAALWGAGRDLPLAGQGVTASSAKQACVRLLLASGSIASLLALGAMIVSWRGWHFWA